MPTDGTSPAPPSPADFAVQHLLNALRQALDVHSHGRDRDERAQLRLLHHRAQIALTSLTRLVSDPRSDALDYMSEADHILHQLADLREATPGRPPRRWRGWR